jgi:hypothetical protein
MFPDLGIKLKEKPGYFQIWEISGFGKMNGQTSRSEVKTLLYIPSECVISAFFRFAGGLIVEIHIPGQWFACSKLHERINPGFFIRYIMVLQHLGYQVAFIFAENNCY